VKVLVLDDDPAASAEIPVQLGISRDFDVVVAASVEEAAFALKHERFEMALVAVRESDPSGFDIGRTLKEQFPSLTVGFVTDKATPQMEQVAAQYSTIGLLEKPLTRERIVSIWERVQPFQSSEAFPQAQSHETTGGATVSGFKLVDVVQMCCISQKTGRLKVHENGREGTIFLQTGAIVHAEVSDMEGDEAVYEMVGWERPSTLLEENAASPKVTISTGWEHLLLEGTRRRDEQGKAAAPAGDLRLEAGEEGLMGKMIGPFMVEQKIDSDYWGVLYEALQVAVNRKVALKVLSPSFYGQPAHVKQFTAFASAMARAQNPYLTSVYEAGQANGLIFYAREHSEGCSFLEYLRKERDLPEELALTIVTNVSEALNYEKKTALLHTPLTPNQILIPDTGVPKLLNNVTIEGGEISAGELDEMRRLGSIVKQAMTGATVVSLNFKVFLEKIGNAGNGGFNDWDALLYEARHLDLHRRATRVVRPLYTSTARIPVPVPRRKTGWVKYAILGLVVCSLAGGVLWYFAFRTSGGAIDVEAMVAIPSGSFIYQSNEKLSLTNFSIDKYEVTVSQYGGFLTAWNRDRTAIREHPERSQKEKDHLPDQWNMMLEAIKTGAPMYGGRIYENTPVFNIDYYDAWAYAQWVGKRLPKEQEWEKAARGPNGNIFPWGNKFDARYTNSATDLRPEPLDPAFGKIDGFGVWAQVGAVSGDQSYYGVRDMAGNVSEWTDSWDINPDVPTQKVPVIRGGSWASKDVQLVFRDCSQKKLTRSRQIGFRCVSDKPPATK